MQQHLQSSDLLWEEGKSLAWSHPGEMNEIKDQMTTEPSAAANPPEPSSYTSLYSDEIEQKAEEIRQRALAYAATQNFYRKPPVLQQDHGPKIHMVNEEDLHVVYHRRERGTTAVQWIAACLVMGFLGTTWYKGGSLFENKQPAVDAVATQLSSSSAHSAIVQQPKQQNTAIAVVADSAATASDSLAPVSAAQNFTASLKKQPVNLNQAEDSVRETLAQPDAVALRKPEQSPVEKTNTETPVEAEEKKSDSQVTAEKKIAALKDTDTVKEKVAIEPAEDVEEGQKKKSLGQAIKGIFRKKNRQEKEG